MKRGIFHFVFFSLAVCLLFSSPLKAEETPSAPALDVKELIKKIEIKRGTWTHLKAEIEFDFLTGDQTLASCTGTLTYQRLDESLLIQCYQPAEKLVFALKTDDRRFELYLPAHGTVYKGNIFTLQDSPEIESHLRAWDLYRALKSEAVPDNASFEIHDGKYSLAIPRPNHQDLIARDLKVSQDYKVEEESFYDFEGNPSVEIKRSDFKPLSKSSDAAFARKIFIAARKNTLEGSARHETALLFKSADFDSPLSENAFQLTLPEDTRTLELEDSVIGG